MAALARKPTLMLLFLSLFIFLHCAQRAHCNSAHPLTYRHSNSYRHKLQPASSYSKITALDSSPEDGVPKSEVNYSRVMMVGVSIGNPPQIVQMMLDTGSQLLAVPCAAPNATSSSGVFDPKKRASIKYVSCADCDRLSSDDYSITKSCQNSTNRCRYDFFYADSTEARGDLISETLRISKVDYSLIIGCDESVTEGVLGFNLGILSFPSQSKTTKFSYCISKPSRWGEASSGLLNIGENKFSKYFRTTPLVRYLPNDSSPNKDSLAYTVQIKKIWVGNTPLPLPESAFVSDFSGAGQTIVDSATELTYFVDEIYDALHRVIMTSVGNYSKWISSSRYSELCFLRYPVSKIGQSIGKIVFQLKGSASIVVTEDRVLTEFGDELWCLPFARSSSINLAGNIIGNIHQQNHWFEYDIGRLNLGIRRSDQCRRIA